ncbi:MAG TPA: hypothetical protein PKV71_12795 [Calditrichia bacterium]|nr:hypothetical protein [Calditrichota bacterium]HQV32754.1 hypothetical protein [Calditrichia bacterium]
MYRNEILATIRLAHHFGSAFTADQTYRYLRVAMARPLFDHSLATLVAEGVVVREDALYFEDLTATTRCKKKWSRDLFGKYRKDLGRLVRLPGVRFASLTGANAFESCAEKDDIDLFFVTRADTLWLTYFAMVIFTKIKGLRPTFCINFLVDEKHLHIEQQDYFTAVQLIQMIPLCDSDIGKALLGANPWIFDYLPNADPGLIAHSFYRLSRRHKRASLFPPKFLAGINRLIYRSYRHHLAKKYPSEIGRGLDLRPGMAKLNRLDHRDLYQEIYRKIDLEIAAECQA